MNESKLQKLFIQVKEMRELQRQYFASKGNQALLDLSKASERRVDETILEIDTKQTNLFAQ